MQFLNTGCILASPGQFLKILISSPIPGNADIKSVLSQVSNSPALTAIKTKSAKTMRKRKVLGRVAFNSNRNYSS